MLRMSVGTDFVTITSADRAAPFRILGSRSDDHGSSSVAKVVNPIRSLHRGGGDCDDDV